MKNTLRRASTLLALGTFLATAATPARASEGATPPHAISASVERVTSLPVDDSAFQAAQPQTTTPTPKRKRSALRTFAGAVLGGAVGLVGGAIIGSNLAGDCRCDDAGLGGAIVGGSVGLLGGTIVGGVVGGK